MTTPKVHTVKRGWDRFYVNPNDGALVPSVTTILGIMDKPAIPRWAAKEVAEYAVRERAALEKLPPEDQITLLKGAPWKKRDKAADIGTQAHSYAEQILLSAPGTQIMEPPGLGNAGDGIRRVLDKLKPDPLLTEATAWHYRANYAGTFDGLWKIGTKKVLVDWKTGAGVYGEAGLQLAAYQFAETVIAYDGEEEEMPHIDFALLLHCPREGKASIVRLDLTQEDHEAFLAAAKLFNWRREREDVVLSRKIAL